MSEHFTLDETGLASLAENYPVETGHDALLAIEAALPGTSDKPLITGPGALSAGLLADSSGGTDGYRILACPDSWPAGAAFLASDVQRASDFGQPEVPDENDGLYDTAAIIRGVVEIADDLLDFASRLYFSAGQRPEDHWRSAREETGIDTGRLPGE